LGRASLAGLPGRIGRYPSVLAVVSCWSASRAYTALLLVISTVSGVVPLGLCVAFAIFAGAVASPSTSTISVE